MCGLLQFLFGALRVKTALATNNINLVHVSLLFDTHMVLQTDSQNFTMLLCLCVKSAYLYRRTIVCVFFCFFFGQRHYKIKFNIDPGYMF